MIGALTALLVVMKGLPLAYAKDMQEDKEGAMDALGALSLSIAAMAGMVADLDARHRAHEEGGGRRLRHRHRSRRLAGAALKIPFREAHHIAGRIVAKAAEQGVALHRLPLAAMQEIEPRITRRRLFRAIGRPFGEEPDELWRHRAQKRARAGQEMAAQAGKRAILTSP